MVAASRGASTAPITMFANAPRVGPVVECHRSAMRSTSAMESTAVETPAVKTASPSTRATALRDGGRGVRTNHATTRVGVATALAKWVVQGHAVAGAVTKAHRNGTGTNRLGTTHACWSNPLFRLTKM